MDREKFQIMSSHAKNYVFDCIISSEAEVMGQRKEILKIQFDKNQL